MSDHENEGSSAFTPNRRKFLQTGAIAGVTGAIALMDAAPAAAAPRTSVAEHRGAHGDRIGTPGFDPVRAPAFPLAVKSPYLSTWLPTSALPGTWPSFWTGHTTAFTGLARIDGTTYVFMGDPALPDTSPFPTMRQTEATITATRSTFVLEQAGVRLTVVFLSPIEPGDLKRQSQPLSYVSVTASATDRSGHKVQVYVDISGEWADNDVSRPITWSHSGGDPVTLSYELASPKPLAENGNMATWGTIALSATAVHGLSWQISEDTVARTAFTSHGALADTSDSDQPRAINDRWPVFAFARDLGTVRHETDGLTLSVGHIRTPAVSYLGDPLPPLWSAYWSSGAAMISDFHRDFRSASARASRLDRTVEQKATRAGGSRYAAICALGMRQAFGGTELVSRKGEPWAFLKEISSDGNVSTVDVTYPSMPIFAALDPAYLGLLLAPILDYAENGGWPKTFAEHDLGSSYPNAAGHNDGKEEDMPVEESSNMLIMAAAYAQRVDKKAAASFATAHYKILKQWADYLVDNALDPGYQNQTDDFTGFIAHSVNLALKGIIGIGAMSVIATIAGKESDAAAYLSTAKSYISQWQTKAMDSSGKHLKLAYDQDGTWSLKYNGFADHLLGLGLVPASVEKLESAWYLEHANTYGVPLDIRHTYTKADWQLFTAAWLKDRAETRDTLIESVYTFADTTRSRVPMTDWYDTVGDAQSGFQARPVVGGFFSFLALED